MIGDCAVDITGWVTFACPHPGCTTESHYPPDQVPRGPLCVVGHPPAEMYQVTENAAELLS